MSAETFNACEYLVDRQVEAGRGDNLAVTGPAGSLTYTELAARAAELAAGFGDYGVRPEERVLLVATDRPETVITFCALLRMGAVPVPVSTMYRGEELGELLRDSRARVVVATPECAEVARAAVRLAPEAATLVLTGEPEAPGQAAPAGEAHGTSVRAWADILAAGQQAGPAAPYGTWFDSPAFWLYTSGTTGRPKAAMHRHGSVARVCENYAHQVLGIRQQDRCYSVAKLFFAYGLGNSLLFPFSAGATAVLDPARATPGGAADGFYTCLGRSNDMIKASGIWVSPMEVEGRLLEHPSVAECAVVGHRNTAGLEEVVACVVPAPGQSVDADGLIAFCREGLASFKRPRQVLALDALPKTATGKIQRVVVREVVAQRLGKPGE